MDRQASASSPPTALPDLPPRFEPVRKLGAGGFGSVWEVRDTDTGQRLAFKRLERIEAEAIYRFKQEFRVVSECQHTNLVRLHEFFAEHGGWGFTMDLVEGVRFDHWVRGVVVHRGGDSATTTAGRASGSSEPTWSGDATQAGDERISESGIVPRADSSELRNLRKALPGLVAGVLALHESGILHRDLKPSNALVDPSGRVTILDFGLALPSGLSESAALRAGTPAYMSPEQARGGQLTMASDWYSVGVMLYEALTGFCPFSGTAADILAAKRSRAPRDPRSVREGLPDDLCDLALALLDRDPSQRPNGFAVARRVGLSASIAASSRHVLEGAFVGRQGESRALRHAFDRMRTGHPVVAHVHGRSGLGKTTLIRRFIADLSLRDEVALLEGRCFERESVPFKAIDELVDSLGRYLARLKPLEAASLMPRDAQALVRLFPSLGRLELLAGVRGRAPGSDLYELRRRAFGAFREVLARLSDSRSVVLVLDDLHWGDRDSADLLRHLLAPPEVPPLLLIASYRPLPAPNELVSTLRAPQAMDADWEVVDVPVEPLARREARALARQLLSESHTNGADAEALADEAAGSPLLIAELVRAAARNPGGARVTMADVIDFRRARLSHEAVEVLRMLAISDRPLPVVCLARACGKPEDEAAKILELLRDEHLASVAVNRGQSEFEIFHDRIRQVILEQVAVSDQASLHAALAEALEEQGSNPETIYQHFRRAGRDERAALWAEQAGDRAATMAAFEQAAALYREAVDASPAAAVDTPARRKLAQALARSGHGAKAAEQYLSLVASGARDHAVLRRRAGEQLLRAGDIERGMSTLGQAAQSAGLPFPKTPKTALASLLFRRARLRMRGFGYRRRRAVDVPEAELNAIDLCWAIGNGLSGIDVVRSAHYHSLCLWLALECGEPSRVARSLGLEGALTALESVESAERAEAVLARAEQLGTEIEDPHALGWALCGRAIQAWTRTDIDRCIEHCEQAHWHLREKSEETFREMGSLEVWFHLHALFLRGHLDRVAERAPACAREAEMRGDRYTLSTVRAYVLPLLWAARDEPEQARHEAERAVDVWPPGVWYHQHWAHLRAHCFLDLYEGQGERIVERVRLARPRMKAAMHLRLRTPRLEVNYLEGRGALERMARGASAKEAKRLEALIRSRIVDLDRENTGLAHAYARTLESGLLASKDAAAAVEAFGQLVETFDELTMPLHGAAAAFRQSQCRMRVDSAADGQLSAAAAQRSLNSLSERGVARPERFADLLIPRLPDHGS